MVVMFVLVAALGVAYGHFRSESNAGTAALRDASVGARVAASHIDQDLESTRAKLTRLAADPQVTDLLGKNPPPCSIDYSAPGSFTTGHLDIIAVDGTVACSSLATPMTSGYHEADWIPSALDRAMISAPVDDRRTGRRVIVVSAPLPGHGVVAAFLDLGAVGPGLLSTFGGPRKLEFLVTTGDGQRAVTRSIDPQRWVGAPLAGTPFTDSPLRPHGRDVDGISRFYASAPVVATGWRVYAGADRSRALAATHALNPADLAVALIMLAVVLATGLVVFRRTASPISALVEQVRLPMHDSRQQPVPIGGAREIAELATHLNHLRESLHDELEATARSAAIVESSNDSIISWTHSGIITTWNSKSEQMYGYPTTEAIGRDMSLVVPPSRIAELRRLHDLVLRGDPVPPVEIQEVRRDGGLVDVSVTLSPIRDQTGVVVGVSAVGRDVTESKRAVEALRSSEARKDAILTSALDAVITLSDHGRIDEFNPAAERIFGCTAAEVIGRRLSDVMIPPGQRDAGDHGLEQFLATGEGYPLGRCTELTAKRANGSLFPAEVTINRVGAPGPPVFTGLIRDLTDRKAAEGERRSLEDRLHQSQRLESLGQLAGGVAHDFNNLLAVILNYATFVAEALPDDGGLQSDVEQILSAAEQAAGLTRQLLMFARREPVRPETLDLNAVVEEVRGLLARSLGEQIDLIVNAGAGLPAIRADRGQTEQILLNLAVNARDAMPDGGVLTIDTDISVDAEPGHPHPGTTRRGPYVRLSVSDNGTGMSQYAASRAFEPFFTTKARTEGSGLGLATVYGIITEAGGAVNLYSEEGVGTTVKVYFPCTADAKAAVRAGPRPTLIRGHGETILVVEDQDAVRAVTARILGRNGYVVVEAASGADALSVASHHDIDLLLTDVVMPKMAGRQLAEHLTADQPDLPVLYMSGFAQSILGPQRALEEGVALIQKPFNETSLLKSVNEAITVGVRSASGSDAVVAR